MIDVVSEFENKIAEFFGSPYAVAIDCCTHAVELCLRYSKAKLIEVPTRAYPSIPALAEKLGIELEWKEETWEDYYHLTPDVIDAAVLWKRGSYISDTYMCLSFQFQKHLSLGRGGMILTDDLEASKELKRMSYDGREPNVPWREQNIKSMGYHYYMTPETAQLGINKLHQAMNSLPREWSIEDWPDLRTMGIFEKQEKELL